MALQRNGLVAWIIRVEDGGLFGKALPMHQAPGGGPTPHRVPSLHPALPVEVQAFEGLSRPLVQHLVVVPTTHPGDQLVFGDVGINTLLGCGFRHPPLFVASAELYQPLMRVMHHLAVEYMHNNWRGGHFRGFVFLGTA